MSSNQVFEISGSFDQLHLALDFAIKFDGAHTKDLVFQTTEDGKYCVMIQKL